MRKEEYIVLGKYNCYLTQYAINTIVFYSKKYKLVEIGDDDSGKYIRRLKREDIIPQIFYYDPIRTYGREDMEVHLGGLDELYAWFKAKSSGPRG